MVRNALGAITTGVAVNSHPRGIMYYSIGLHDEPKARVSAYQLGLHDAAVNSHVIGLVEYNNAVYGAHWATLGRGYDFNTKALNDWGPMTSEDVNFLRTNFDDLPPRPLCARPKVIFNPNIKLTSFTGLVLEIKKRVSGKMGIYAVKTSSGRVDARPGPTGKWVPCTTIAMLEVMYHWIQQLDRKGARGSATLVKRQWLAMDIYFTRADNLLKSEAKRRNLSWGSQGYEDLAKSIVLPFKAVKGFWSLCLAIAQRKGVANIGVRSFWNKVLDFGSASWNVTKGHAKSIVKGIKRGFGYIWREFGIYIIIGLVAIAGIWYFVTI